MASTYQDDIPAYKPPVSTVKPTGSTGVEEQREDTALAEEGNDASAIPSQDREIHDLINKILEEEEQSSSTSSEPAVSGEGNEPERAPRAATESVPSPNDREIRETIEKILREETSPGESAASEEKGVPEVEQPETEEKSVAPSGAKTVLLSPDKEETHRMIDETLKGESADQETATAVVTGRETSTPIAIESSTETEESQELGEEDVRRWLKLTEDIEALNEEYRKLKRVLANPQPDQEGRYSVYSKENIKRFNSLRRGLGRAFKEREEIEERFKEQGEEIEERLKEQGWIFSKDRRGGFRIALSTSSRGTKMIEVIDVFGNPGVRKGDVWAASLKHIASIPQVVREKILTALTWGVDGWAEELYKDIPETSDEELEAAA